VLVTAATTNRAPSRRAPVTEQARPEVMLLEHGWHE
jgi:hypothetical protein